MGNDNDLRGERFGRLLVESYSHSSGSPSYNKYWSCLCDCGDRKTVRGNHLKIGNIRSCGCLSRTTDEKRKANKKRKDAKYRRSSKGGLTRKKHIVLRKARKKGAAGEFSQQHLTWIRQYQGDTCNYCKTELHGNGHLDHIKPISKGGSNWPANLQWLCEKCNLVKGNKWPYPSLDTPLVSTPLTFS